MTRHQLGNGELVEKENGRKKLTEPRLQKRRSIGGLTVAGMAQICPIVRHSVLFTAPLSAQKKSVRFVCPDGYGFLAISNKRCRLLREASPGFLSLQS